MAEWNLNCPNCIHYKPLEICPFTACQFTPVRIVTTNKIQMVETDSVEELISNNCEPLVEDEKLNKNSVKEE